MNQELLAYFERELKFLAEDAVEFARRRPESAGLLDPDDGTPADPHVEIFTQGLALLNADLQMKLDGCLPDAADFLFSSLFPHLKQPVPSMAIVQFEANRPGQRRIPAGTQLTSEPVNGTRCRFQTCYPVEVQPITVRRAALTSRRSNIVRSSNDSDEVASLTLNIEVAKSARAELPGRMRCFLNGERSTTFPLYELLRNHATRMVVRASGAEQIIHADPHLITAVGFDRSEAGLPWPSRSDDAYRVLTEFFHFPEKFLFLDFPAWQVDPLTVDDASATDVEVTIHFDRAIPEMESRLRADTFQLNCTPVVNAFRGRAEPIRLTHQTSDYPVQADVRHQVDMISIERVTAVSDSETHEIPEFFQPTAGLSDTNAGEGPFWVTRRDRQGEGRGGMSISVADPALKLSAPDQWVLDLTAILSHADLPAKLPYRGTGPKLTAEDADSIASRCLVAPTVSRPPIDQLSARRALTTLLTIRSLPLVDDSSDHRRLRAVLQQHDHADSAETQQMIEGLVGARVKEAFEEIFVERSRVFCCGSEVTLRIDESRYPGGSAFLFANVLSEYLARSCSLNSFVRLNVECGDRAYSFRPATGEQKLHPVC